MYVCCLDRGKKRDRNRMEQFDQTMSRAAVQEADRLAKKLAAAAAKINMANKLTAFLIRRRSL